LPKIANHIQLIHDLQLIKFLIGLLFRNSNSSILLDLYQRNNFLQQKEGVVHQDLFSLSLWNSVADIRLEEKKDKIASFILSLEEKHSLSDFDAAVLQELQTLFDTQ